MGRTIIVTGTSGHLGNTLARNLAERGEDVRGLVRKNSNREMLRGHGIDLYDGDITDYDSLDDIFSVPKGTDLIVVHTAGIVSTTSGNYSIVKKVNVDGTRNIVERCIQHGAKRLIYTSSVHAIEEPSSGEKVVETSSFNPENVVGIYAKTKAEASQIVMDSGERGLDIVIVHPSGIIGPNDYGSGHTTQLILDYLQNKLWAIVNGGYDFVDVRDVAEGIVSAIDRGKSGECYILSGRYVSVEELFSILSEITGKKRISKIIPMWLAKMTAPLSELYYKIRRQKPMYSSYSLYTLTSNSDFSNEKAKKELGFKSRELKKSLEDTVEWIEKSHIEIKR